MKRLSVVVVVIAIVACLHPAEAEPSSPVAICVATLMQTLLKTCGPEGRPCFEKCKARLELCVSLRSEISENYCNECTYMITRRVC
jgi:hypothetical protein